MRWENEDSSLLEKSLVTPVNHYYFMIIDFELLEDYAYHLVI